MTSFNFMLSGADEEILNALRMADDIATEVNSTASNHIYDEASKEFDTCFTAGGASVFVSDFSEDSGCPKLQEFNKTDEDDEILNKNSDEQNLFRLEPEYQNLLQNVSSLQLMCDLTIEESRKIKAENKALITNLVQSSKQVLSVAMLSDNLEKIKTISSHILTISKQFRQIKQVLGNAPSKNTLKVNPSCQKHVIKFFHFANELMGSLEKSKECIEACLKSDFDNWNPIRKQLQLRISEALEEIERRVDNLTEFRSNLGVISTGGTECSSKKTLECFDNPPISGEI